MRSEAKTVSGYLKVLPDERRDAIRTVRDVILANLPEGYVEAMDWGMISYQVPLATYPDTYNEKPLMYAALASQKGYMVVYLSAIYADKAARERFERAYKAAGKRYDVGQSCVRFKRLDDLPLDVIAAAIASTPVDEFIDRYQKGRGSARPAAKSRAKKGDRAGKVAGGASAKKGGAKKGGAKKGPVKKRA
ncbi:MAG: DUF1801 domain-containing protein [Gemmatimonadetes bacterium]|nr:DUF1801 domain-containing protein [Gemmatimonadota bacterium]